MWRMLPKRLFLQRKDITLLDLVAVISSLVGYSGEIVWDTSKPDGQPRRCLDVSRAEKEFGFKAQTTFEDGLKETIAWYIEKQ